MKCDNLVKYGVSAFVAAGRLWLRFYNKELDRTILPADSIKFCPMCGHEFKGEK